MVVSLFNMLFICGGCGAGAGGGDGSVGDGSGIFICVIYLTCGGCGGGAGGVVVVYMVVEG